MSGEHNHEHGHSHSHASNRRRLVWVIVLTVVYMMAEVVGGLLTNSLALLSDAGHMLADVAALVLALLALWFAARPITPRKTYGYYRMEILAALANGVALVVISLLIAYEAFHRIKSPESVEGFDMLLIATGGLAVNIISAWLLHSASDENLNMRGAFLHILGDALGSVGAIVAGLVIWQWGWTIADPIISVLMCLLDPLQFVAAYTRIREHTVGRHAFAHQHSRSSRSHARCCGSHRRARPAHLDHQFRQGRAFSARHARAKRIAPHDARSASGTVAQELQHRARNDSDRTARRSRSHTQQALSNSAEERKVDQCPVTPKAPASHRNQHKKL